MQMQAILLFFLILEGVSLTAQDLSIWKQFLRRTECKLRLLLIS